jgi:thiamine biosynthesis lipoprotein
MLRVRRGKVLAVVSTLVAGAAVHTAATATTPKAGDPVATRAELVMGSIARITLPDGVPGEAWDAAFAALRAVDATMSLYRPESALVRVNAHAAEHPEAVDEDLYECLARARALGATTDGAFDPTVLPLLKAWGAYPGLDHVAAGNAEAVGWDGLVLDPAARTVAFRRPGMGVDLGGIAKGFALDRARAALTRAGVARAVLDLGGNLAMMGAGPGPGWRIAVREPSAPEGSLGVLTLGPDQTASTSGNYARDFAHEGWRAPSHIYDPRNGRPVASGLTVTVWAPDGATAAALSTALLVLGP